jgi:hypothetical protein
VHSRWLTTPCRILRLYVGTKKPPQNSKILVKFIVTVYAPMWFEIKNKPSCANGAQHLWKIMYLTKQTIKTVVLDVIQKNAYFSHSENVLISILTYSDKSIPELAVQKIIFARKNNNIERKFSVPLLNFNADCYVNVVT